MAPARIDVKDGIDTANATRFGARLTHDRRRNLPSQQRNQEVDPVRTYVAGLQRAGWHVAPQASLWNVTSEIYADRWWSPNLVDTALISMTTGHGLGQRV